MRKDCHISQDIIKPWFDFCEKRPSLGTHGALKTPKDSYYWKLKKHKNIIRVKGHGKTIINQEREKHGDCKWQREAYIIIIPREKKIFIQNTNRDFLR